MLQKRAVRREHIFRERSVLIMRCVWMFMAFCAMSSVFGMDDAGRALFAEVEAFCEEATAVGQELYSGCFFQDKIDALQESLDISDLEQGTLQERQCIIDAVRNCQDLAPFMDTLVFTVKNTCAWRACYGDDDQRAFEAGMLWRDVTYLRFCAAVKNVTIRHLLKVMQESFLGQEFLIDIGAEGDDEAASRSRQLLECYLLVFLKEVLRESIFEDAGAAVKVLTFGTLLRFTQQSEEAWKSLGDLEKASAMAQERFVFMPKELCQYNAEEFVALDSRAGMVDPLGDVIERCLAVDKIKALVTTLLSLYDKTSDQCADCRRILDNGKCVVGKVNCLVERARKIESVVAQLKDYVCEVISAERPQDVDGRQTQAVMREMMRRSAQDGCGLFRSL